MISVSDLLSTAAAQFPDKPFVIAESRNWTYAQLVLDVESVMSTLIMMGVRRGDRIVIALNNRSEFVVMFFAVISLGAIAVPTSPFLPPDKLRAVLSDCEPTVFLGGPGIRYFQRNVAPSSLKWVVGVSAGIDDFVSPWLQFKSFKECLVPSSSTINGANTIDLDPAMIVYTSGSTGLPKGIVCSHRNILAATSSIKTYLNLQTDDRILNFQPLFFDYGLYQFLLAAAVSATVCLVDGLRYPSEVLTQIREYRTTVLPCVPTSIQTLLNRVDAVRPLASVRILTNTGAPFPVQSLPALRVLFPRASIFSMYGLSECKRVSFLQPDLLDRRFNSVGKAMPNVRAWVVDECGERVPPSVVGELVVQGSNVSIGYWRDEASTAEKFRTLPTGERVLFTGDFFKSDDEGYLYFVGRRDDMVKIGGYRVTTTEIERTILGLAEIDEVAALSIPDVMLGTSTKVFVVLKRNSPVDASQLLDRCRNLFESSVLIPKIIEIVDYIPKTDTGKIDYAALRERESQDS